MDIDNLPFNFNEEEFLKSFESTQYANNFQEASQKLSDAKHEIVFNITANILEEDKEGNKIGTRKICTKFYHIPVPSGGDCDAFGSAFFDFLENSLAQAATQAYTQTNPDIIQKEENTIDE